MSNQSAAQEPKPLLRLRHEPLAEALSEELRKLHANQSALVEEADKGNNQGASQALHELQEKALILEKGIQSVEHR